MITPNQIKAARALIDWSQQNLADQCDMSKTAIANIESGLSRPTEKNMAHIRECFDRAGVEFIDGGVRGIRDKVRVLEGEKAITFVFDDIINVLREENENNRNLLIFGVDEKKFLDNYPNDLLNDHLLLRRKYGIKQKLLLCEGDINFIDGPDVYKWIPKEYFSTTPTLVYGDRVATILWTSPIEVVIAKNSLYAEERRKIFDLIWEKIAVNPRG